MKLQDNYTPEELRDEDEAISHSLTEEAMRTDFDLHPVLHREISSLLTMRGDMTVVEAYNEFADPEQQSLVEEKTINFDEDRIVILDGLRVVDGNHHLIAAHLTGRSIKTINLEDSENTSEPMSP